VQSKTAHGKVSEGATVLELGEDRQQVSGVSEAADGKSGEPYYGVLAASAAALDCSVPDFHHHGQRWPTQGEGRRRHYCSGDLRLCSFSAPAPSKTIIQRKIQFGLGERQSSCEEKSTVLGAKIGGDVRPVFSHLLQPTLSCSSVHAPYCLLG
jgi:hypothetical protein